LITALPGEATLFPSTNAPGSAYEPPNHSEMRQRNADDLELLRAVEKRCAVGSLAHPAWKAEPSLEMAPSSSVRLGASGNTGTHSEAWTQMGVLQSKPVHPVSPA
jgi:hypothetical protein